MTLSTAGFVRGKVYCWDHHAVLKRDSVYTKKTAELGAELNKIANTEVNQDNLEVDKSNLKGVYPVINKYLPTVSQY